MERFTKKNVKTNEYGEIYTCEFNVSANNKLGRFEDIQEILESNSNYALMYVDKKYVIVDTTNNAFDILKAYDDNFNEVEL